MRILTSTRSSSGPDSLPRYLRRDAGEQRHSALPGTEAFAHGHEWLGYLLKYDNEVPLLPSYVASILGFGVLAWLVRKGDKYSKTERRVLYTALILVMALGAIGWGIISLIEPYADAGS